jgi:hypothetical protein
MNLLYHGSGFKQEELMPGFKRSGKLVRWDETESNEFLYTTTDKTEAISQAFASMLEKHYDSVHYKTDKNRIDIKMKWDYRPGRDELARLEIFLYTIEPIKEDGWIKVNNAVNGLETEYKTRNTIKESIVSREEVDLIEWLKGKDVHIALENQPAYVNW